MMLVPLGAIGIAYLLKSNWESKLIKELTLIMLLLGLIFSSASFLNSYKNAQPSEEIIDSLKFLKENSEEQDVVLSHFSNGIWINSIASRKNVIDSKTLFAPKINERNQDVNAIFQSRNLEKTNGLLEKYKINYIYITPEMKKGLVWNSEEQGLLFVLKFTPQDFEKIYKTQGIEIWRVK